MNWTFSFASYRVPLLQYVRILTLTSKHARQRKCYNLFIFFMRVLFVYVIILTANLNFVVGQDRNVYKEDITDITRRSLVLVDSFRTDMKYFIVDPQKIESISVYKDSNSLRKFGAIGKNGVIAIQPKPNTTFLQIDRIMNRYNVPAQNKTLRICIDKIVVGEPALILIEESEILDVEITTERYWSNFEDANSGEKFINIITRAKHKKGS